METHFAPPHRSAAEVTLASYINIHRLPFVRNVINAAPYAMVLLNSHRQIIYANAALCDLLKIEQPNMYVGQRPGELMNCINAIHGPDGCGTSEACQNCGGINAFLESRKTNSCASRDMTLTVVKSGQINALDFHVTAAPFVVEQTIYTIVSYVDSSHEKRKRVLERIFFHDILNTAGNLVSLSELIYDSLPKTNVEVIDLISLCAKQLVEEIKSHQLIMKAENNELTVQYGDVQTMDCLKQVAEMYLEFGVARKVAVRIDAHAQQVAIHSDKTLLLRVLGNLAKNALEASSEGDTVTIGCHRIHNHVQFWTHNKSYIPRNIQLQIFQRSFSTKGNDRGLGTYSIKLLIENYLGGSVAFDSARSEGTHFYITIPMLPPGVDKDNADISLN